MVIWLGVLLLAVICDLLALRLVRKLRPEWSNAQQAWAAIVPGHLLGLLPLAIFLVPLSPEMIANDEGPLMFAGSVVLTIAGQICALFAGLVIAIIAARLPATE